MPEQRRQIVERIDFIQFTGVDHRHLSFIFELAFEALAALISAPSGPSGNLPPAQLQRRRTARG
jgi:hypothetical protein